MSEFTVPVVTRCNTCKAAFSSVEIVREHYRTDWHVFNSKRRANGLPHVTLEEYRRQFPVKKKRVAQNTPMTKTQSPPPPVPTDSSGKGMQVTREKSPDEPVKFDSSASAPAELSDNIQNASKVDDIAHNLKALALNHGVEPENVDGVVAAAVEAEPADETADADDSEEDGEEDTDEVIIIEPNISIFDDKEFVTVDECVTYMETAFGFFIPEREYLVDLPGLLTYLGEKVKIGGICLYCQKQLRPGRPCQNHMISKSHCKIAYEEEVDVDEFEEFYDFSSSYAEGGDDEDLGDDALEVSAIGELVLTDGRSVGHRAFRRYYKQNHKPIDDRASVAAQRREGLLRARMTPDMLGIADQKGPLTSSALRSLSETEVMSLIVRQHKELRKMQQIEQRAAQRKEYRHKMREYMSTKDKLRSSINTTDKIRDYHGMLM